MRELSRIMPERSWLQTTDAQVTAEDDVAPVPDGGTTLAGTTGPTANLVGCTPAQSDVARMMVRMKRMYRVDRRQAQRVHARGRDGHRGRRRRRSTTADASTSST